MMWDRTIGRAWRKLQRLRRYPRPRTHPGVAWSTVQDYSLVDPTATVLNSKLEGQVSLGPWTVLDRCHLRGSSPISIGKRSNLSGPITIIADIQPIRIGKFCSFAPEVAIWEAMHNANGASSYFIMSEMFDDDWRLDVVSKGPIEIGHDVWIGTKSVVLSGVSIGNGAVIGAGSVVTKDVPPYVIAAGSPAVIQRSRFAGDLCARLEEHRWWDWDDDKIRRNRAFFENDLTPELFDRIL